MSPNTYCINLKTGRIGASSPGLLRSNTNMVLSNDNHAVELHVKHGIQSFEVIPSADGVGYVFKPRIPPAPRANASAEDVAKYKAMIAAATGVDESIQEHVDNARVDPMSIGLSMEGVDEDGNPKVYDQELIAEVRGGVRYVVPDDFDVNIDLQPLNKPELVNVANQIEGFPLPQSVHVKQLRVMLQDALAEVKSYAKAPVAAAIEVADDGTETAVERVQHTAPPEGQQGFPVQPQGTLEEQAEAKDAARAEKLKAAGPPAAPIKLTPTPMAEATESPEGAITDETPVDPDPVMDLGGEPPPPPTGVNSPSPAEQAAAQAEEQAAAVQPPVAPPPPPTGDVPPPVDV